MFKRRTSPNHDEDFVFLKNIYILKQKKKKSKVILLWWCIKIKKLLQEVKCGGKRGKRLGCVII